VGESLFFVRREGYGYHHGKYVSNSHQQGSHHVRRDMATIMANMWAIPTNKDLITIYQDANAVPTTRFV
jgi:hypothetical protein